MALITSRNILVPFTNKLHLTTIILIVMAFAILRLSGGEIDLIRKNNFNIQKNGLVSEGINALQNNQSNKQVQKNRQPEQPSSNEATSLDDIEKMFQ